MIPDYLPRGSGYRGGMTIGEDFLLLVTHPESGKCRLSSMVADIALGGANLIDLIRAERVELTGKKSKTRVILSDKTPLDNPVLDRAILTLQAKGPMRPQAAVRQLGKKAKLPLYEALEANGEVRRKQEKVLGVFTVTRWPVFDTVSRDNLIRLIQSSLLFELDATERTGPLIGLLAASNSLRLVIDRPELKSAKAQAKVIAKGDWASEEVRKAIQATNAVVLMAAISVAGAGSSSS